MMNCWAKLPGERPSFSSILSTISNYAEVISGYLDINSYNPFESYHSTGNGTTGSNKTATNLPDNDTDIIASSSTEPLVKKDSSDDTKSEDTMSCTADEKKPKALSKASPHSSPQASPEPSTMASAGIEIRIQTPSESES